MKVLLLILTFGTCGYARNLISQGEVDSLFKRFVFNEVTEADRPTLDRVVEQLHHPQPAMRVTRFGEIRATLDCILCRSAFGALFDGVYAGQSDEQLTTTLTTLCVVLSIEGYEVCRGAVGLNMPVLTYIIRTTPLATPGAFCSLVLQHVGDNINCPLQDDRFDWQVDLPEYDGTLVPNTTVSTPLKIALITDAHIDPLYMANGVADCGEPTCCRNGQQPRTSHASPSSILEGIMGDSVVKREGDILLDLDSAEAIRDAKESTRRVETRDSAPAGYWGDYRNCDTPVWAFDNVIEEITENHRDIDLVYYIGDTIDHFVWETSYELIKEMNLYVVEKIRSSFGDDVPVMAAIGNHESQPTNQFAPSSVVGPYINTTWLYASLADKWGGYLSAGARASLRERGGYSERVAPGLRVLSINNNVAYKYNWWLVYDPEDAKRHLEWLVQELHAAELSGERVHILAHIPPGVSDLTHTWTREYNRIVNRFAATIAAEFNGHTHSDEFKIFYDEDDEPIQVAWGAGSATAHTNFNLNYKIVSLDGTTYEPNNIETYIYNLTEANLTPHRKPNWFQLYDIRHRFALPDLSAPAIDSLVTSMVTSHTQYLDLYTAYFSKLSDVRWPTCGENCKLDILCRAVVTVLWERERCENLRQLYFSSAG